MSRSRRNPRRCKAPGLELWKPGPLSGYSHSAENKRLNRRIARRVARVEVKRAVE